MTENSQKPPRWYQGQPPSWFPSWFFACLLVGLASCVTFWLGVGGLTWKELGLAFGVGFGLTLIILSLTYERAKPADQQPGMMPPIWVRLPVIVLLTVFLGAVWACEQRITTGSARGGRVIVEGPTAIVIGFCMMTAPALLIVPPLRRQPRQIPEFIGAIGALLVIAVGYGITIYHLVQSSSP